MLKLNRMTDYAAVILSVLAAQNRFHTGQSLSTTEISQKSGLTQASTAKILKTLLAGGLVNSTRGKNGGYVLNSPPESISVSDVIKVMEGPIALTACVETAPQQCCSKNTCFLSGNWERVNNAINNVLTSITLADLIDPEKHFKTNTSHKNNISHKNNPSHIAG